MSRESVEIVRRALDAFNRRDKAAWTALCDPAIEWSPPREWPESTSVRDPDAIWAFMSELDAPWQRGDYMLSEVIEGDAGRVAGRVERQVRGKNSGAVAEFAYWIVVTVRAGRMLRCDWFSDRAEALEAAGVEE